MLTDKLYQTLFEDLQSAFAFEQKGELNKSRVIARQVAGKAIRVLYDHLNLDTTQGMTPYQYLVDSFNHKEIFSPVLNELSALTTRVNVDFSFSGNMNLITAAENILLFVKEFRD